LNPAKILANLANASTTRARPDSKLSDQIADDFDTALVVDADRQRWYQNMRSKRISSLTYKD